MKVFITLLLLTCSLSAHAVFVIGLHGNGGIWYAEIDGTSGEPANNISALGSAGKSQGAYFNGHLEHPLPLVPNLRIHYTSLTQSRSVFSPDQEVRIFTDIDLTHLDATLYYRLLDNWLNLDAGVSLRKYFGGINTHFLSVDNRQDFNEVLPMAYLAAEVEFPFTGWAIGVEGSYTEFNDYIVSDYSASVRHLLDAVVKIGFEAGYRQMTLDVNKIFGVDLQAQGPFIALAIHF